MSASKLLNLKLAAAVAMLGAFGLLALGIHQETAVGGLRGRAVAQESGNPIPASLYLESKVHGESVYYSRQIGKDGKFEFKRLPVGTYTLGIRSEAHHLKPMKVRVQEGKTVTIEAELQPSEPFMDLYIHQHVFTPGEKPQMTCRGFAQARSILVNTYKVDLDAFLLKSGGSLPSMLGVKSYYDDKSGRWTTLVPDLDNNSSIKRVDSFSVYNLRRDAEGIFNQRIDLARLGPGLYAVSAFADGVRQVGWIMVTSLGLVTKVADMGMLAYTVDLKTGAPVASSDIRVYAGSAQVASGVTDSDGLLKLNIAGASNEDKRVIIARSGESFAFVTPWVSSTPTATNTIYTYTDRPVYRPGQDVFFKGIVRQSTDGGYKVPAGQPVAIEVRDSRDTLIYRTTAKTDRFGCYSGEFTLNEEAGTGYYTISPSINGEEPRQTASFQVAAYRKPEFSVKVNFPRKRCVRGESVKAKVMAE